jgi:phospho-N-acetylmuramoyl-pentapeptide-transferase
MGSILGLFDDMLQVRGTNDDASKGDKDIRFRYIKIALIVLISMLIGAWFYFKLGVSSVAVPFIGTQLALGWLFIPFFIVVTIAVFSGGVIDGLDGLAGGVLAIIFAAYACIAFGKDMIDIAALCGVISGGILAFLWFNIPPARFYMGETGMMGLLVVLTVVAFLTDTVLLLPLIALPLAASSASSLIQITSYKYFGKRRVFKIAPLHHHFRAIGWSKEKVVMRYWVVSIIVAIIGVVIALVS